MELSKIINTAIGCVMASFLDSNKKKDTIKGLRNIENALNAHNIQIGTCENCKHSADEGESVEFIKCTRMKRKQDVLKIDSCKHYKED